MTSSLDLSDPENAALRGYRYQELEFALDGSLVRPEQEKAVAELADSVTDLIVISHGWNNNITEARDLYRRLAESFDTVRVSSPINLTGRTLGILGVLWPSKRFTDAQLIPGGVASMADDPDLPADLRAMSDVFPGDDAEVKLREAADLAPRLEDSVEARDKYADLLRSLISPAEAEPADAAEDLFHMSGDQLLEQLEKAMIASMAGPPPATQPEDTGGIQLIGLGAGLGGFDGIGDDVGVGETSGLFSAPRAIWSKGRALLNYVTYYTMKARAGAIGARSLSPILSTAVIGKARLHLVGHSFGARLVTAAANALPEPGGVSSMSLLQGAFSHNSFSADFGQGQKGGFRHLVDARNVKGPIIVTHTRNDSAVGIAYAIASAIHNQNAEKIGDASSQFGGLGSNGAQHTAEAKDDQELQDGDAT